MIRMAKILVIDDQAGMRRSLAILLKKEGFDVVEAENGKRAIDFLNEIYFDLVVTDLKMSPGTGLDVLFYVKEKHPDTDVIVMTGYGTIDSAVIAMKIGAFDYISKPFKNEEIMHRVRKAIGHVETEREFMYLQNDSGARRTNFPLLGQSVIMQDLISLIERIAKVDIPVLITGETGTGKNLVAKSIHNLSSVAGNPFVSINCAAVPEYLLESELFGHIKGAFTGAHLDRKGLFEAAAGGSLLLDEIGSMSGSTQAKLLDVLHDRKIRPVGSNESQEINARIMAATNADLEAAVKKGSFREDLYYRIKVAHIRIPPLREHREDIPLLARHFLESAADKFNRSSLQLSNDANEFLYNYDFPGNVRELNNIISNTAAISSEPVITRDDLSLSLTNKIFDLSNVPSENSKNNTLEEHEKDVIIRSIEKNAHNLSKVSIDLGIGRTTLWRKMKKYGIN
jgi:two-component system response regulator AtoC